MFHVEQFKNRHKMNFTIEGNIVDVINGKIIKGQLIVINGKVKEIVPRGTSEEQFILPGLIDSHIHIESSMLVPSEFAKIAVKHGTVATVSDPHEIANVLGMEGINFMIENGKRVPFKFFWGAPSCVPATNFETSGYSIGGEKIEELMKRKEIYYLSEVMNYPGVIYKDAEVLKKIEKAKEQGKPIDGHAPGIVGEMLKKYAGEGISTDHECFTKDEALEKIRNKVKIQIREGSAAKNFDALFSLIDQYPKDVMLCSDDLHPDDLLKGHINLLIKKGIKNDVDFFNLLRAATKNPIEHYKLDVGLLQKGDSADFVVIDNLSDFNIKSTYINGKIVFDGNKTVFDYNETSSINNFNRSIISINDIEVKAKQGQKINVIEVIDKELVTKSCTVDAKVENGKILSDVETDVLKIVVVNRYKPAQIQVGFIKNFGLKKGAIGSCIAHDSHNIIAVGCKDEDIVSVANKIIANKGGIAVSDGKFIESLELEIGGIMTSKNIEVVAEKYSQIHNKTKELGSGLTAPLMTLSFMALLVIPSLKIGDKGLFDGDKFGFTNLLVD